MADIIVPALGESITEATVATWFKQVGDAVAMDEPIAELETDKVTVEVNATAAGALESITVQEGDTIEVGASLGVIKEGASGSAPTAEAPKAAAPAPATNPVPTATGGNNTPSPAAERVIAQNNLSASNIAGTGKDGRITKGDAINAAANPAPAVANTASNNEARVERVKMTKLRQTIAKRLKESQDTAAILTTFNEVDMTNVMALRKAYKDEFTDKHGVKLGFMSFFIKAAIKALQDIPAVNASIEGNEIVYHNYVNMGVAVGTKTGLVVPTIFDADQLDFAGIESTIVGLGKKARDGALSMADLQGGTFTISNGGVYGSLLSTPIINPPQSGILGLHKIQERPMVVDGEIKIRPMMYLALSYDHRIIDGAEAVTFLVKIKEAIEDPQRLLLGV